MLSPAIITLPWRPDAAEHYFAPLSALPWAMLLHSGFADHPHNRFDILVAAPRATLLTRDEQTWVDDGETVVVSAEDPLQLLQQQLDRQPFTPQPHDDLPFLGGALGLFGYDLGRRFERLPSHAQADIALADMAVGIYDWALIVDHQRQQISLLSYDDPQQRLQWLEAQTPTPGETFALTSAWQSNMSRQQYGEKFRQVQAYLHSGDCYQVNLAQRFQASYVGDEWQAFRQLNAVNRAPFSAFIRLDEGAILSLSPERFIQLRQGEIQTRPIKGTLPRLDSPLADAQQAEKLANSPKDRAENLMIVDLMRNDIGRVAVPGSVRVPELFVVEPFPAVHHLVSTITARLPMTLHASDLLRAAFPGGSITGAPKVRAMEIIDELEPQRRNAWCGSIGYLSYCGNMDTSITIRTLTAWQGQLYCSAGGRVVTAPTNGACGIVPAVLAYYDHFIESVSPEIYIRYFMACGAIGALYKMNASISGAEVGCQGEVGVACSMAAAGLAELLGASPEQVCVAAEIGMEHNLGLTCDPVAGQVQVPCIERNAIASVKAINAARMAMRRTSEPRVSLDKVIETMYETGKDMNAKYRETSRGGLAIKVQCD